MTRPKFRFSRLAREGTRRILRFDSTAEFKHLRVLRKHQVINSSMTGQSCNVPS